MQYNLEYHKALNKSHILPNVMKGAYTGVSSQFISDIILSLLSFNNEIIIKDIQVSPISNYYASVLTGMLAGLLIIYIDQIALIAVTTIFYNYANRFITNLISGEDLNIRPIEYTFDALIAVMFVVLFDPTAKSQYYRYQQKRHFVEPTIPRTDRSLTLVIFFSILTSTYGFLKITNQTTTEEKTSKMDVKSCSCI